MKNEWYNNEISKRLYEQYNHDFSICDIDGVCRKFYKKDKIWMTRLVIYESKYEREYFSQTQMGTLHVLDKNINWNSFDKYSGVYAILHDADLIKLKIHKILSDNKLPPKYSIKFIKEITMDSFYKWISVKDVEQDYGLSNG